MFTEQEKRIFPYFNGRETVHGDPLYIYRHLTAALGGKLYQVLGESASTDPVVRCAASDRLVAAVREVFAMAPFDQKTGGGASESHCEDALDAFLDFIDAKKKTPGNSPTSSPPTASAPPTSGPGVDPLSITPPTSAST